MKPIPGATLTGRTIVSRVTNFKVGVPNECTGAESLQRLRQQRQHGNGARITKNNAGRGTPSTPQVRPSDVKRRFTHRDFSRPRICAGAICHYPEMKKRGDYTRPQRARTSACSNAQKNTRQKYFKIINAPDRFFHDLHEGANGRGGLDCGKIFCNARKRVYTHAEALRKTREGAFISLWIT